MMEIYFLYGLAFFGMGLAVALESHRASALVLSRHLSWLAAFGLAHSFVEWADMFLLIQPEGTLAHTGLTLARALLLPLSAVLLIRFGIGLVSEAGPLPEWLSFAPVIFLVPSSLLLAYALVVASTQATLETSVDVWSRYLLYFPGCLLAGFGFLRQWRSMNETGLSEARDLLFGAAIALFFNALVGGLVVSRAPYGLAPWLNYDTVLQMFGVPVQVWRAIAAVLVALFVVRAMGVFEFEREQELNHLRIEREQAHVATLIAQREQREVAENWTNSLVNITRRIANLENVDEVLGVTSNMARQLLNADTAALGLWNQAGTQLDMKCYATAEGIETRKPATVYSPLILDAVRSGKLYRFPEDAPSGAEWMSPLLHRPIHAAAIVPLRLEHQLIGGLWVTRIQAHPFTDADLIGLERLADQVVIALEYAVMTARLQSLAVTQERSRIAREMHDGLLQILGYLSLQMQTMEAFLRQGNYDAVRAEISKTRQSIAAAQADVRENVLSLRTTLAGDTGLVESLRDYIAEFEVQTAMQVEFVSELVDESHLSPMAEAQLVRIIQEALANVRKHARASNVQVNLCERGQAVYLSVMDNGIGFIPTEIKNHFGLQTMRERAESIHGILTVNSEIGNGTKIELSLPFLNT